MRTCEVAGGMGDTLMNQASFVRVCLAKQKDKINKNFKDGRKVVSRLRCCRECETGSLVKGGKLFAAPEGIKFIELEQLEAATMKTTNLADRLTVPEREIPGIKLIDLKKYFVSIPEKAGHRGVCVNCLRNDMRITAVGMCSSCYEAGRHLRGRALIKTLNHRANAFNHLCRNCRISATEPQRAPVVNSDAAVVVSFPPCEHEAVVLDADIDLASAVNLLSDQDLHLDIRITPDDLSVFQDTGVEIAGEVVESRQIIGTGVQLNDDDPQFGEPFGATKEYHSLTAVLHKSLQQAQDGKGKSRHAKNGEKFEDQKICEITRRVGLGFPVGQAIKKSIESGRLDPIDAMNELYGAINYLAAAVIVIKEGK